MTNHSFYKYHCDKEKFNRLSLESKHSFSVEFFNDLDRLNKVIRLKEKIKEKKNKYAREIFRIIL